MGPPGATGPPVRGIPGAKVSPTQWASQLPSLSAAATDLLVVFVRENPVHKVRLEPWENQGWV